jgi:hypothetical protein
VKISTRWFLPFAVLAAVGCSSNRQVLRSEMKLQGDPSQTQDGFTLTAKVVALAVMTKDPRLTKAVEVISQGSKKEVPWTLVNPPVFEVHASNRTGHVIKLTGAIFKLIDGAGNLYEPLTKSKLQAETEDAIIQAKKGGMAITQDGIAQLNSGMRALKFMDENTQLLPDIAETFFLAFELPIAQTQEGLNAWLAQQAALRLKIYEVPTRTNEAGVITKRVAFEFPVEVKTFRDTYAVGMMETKLVSSEEVKK